MSHKLSWVWGPLMKIWWRKVCWQLLACPRYHRGQYPGSSDSTQIGCSVPLFDSVRVCYFVFVSVFYCGGFWSKFWSRITLCGFVPCYFHVWLNYVLMKIPHFEWTFAKTQGLFFPQLWVSDPRGEKFTWCGGDGIQRTYLPCYHVWMDACHIIHLYELSKSLIYYPIVAHGVCYTGRALLMQKLFSLFCIVHMFDLSFTYNSCQLCKTYICIYTWAMGSGTFCNWYFVFYKCLILVSMCECHTDILPGIVPRKPQLSISIWGLNTFINLITSMFKWCSRVVCSHTHLLTPVSLAHIHH